jgi:DNA processing protein
MQPIDERTAMLALLLRKEASWRVTTERVLEVGSAIAVLAKEAGRDTLFPGSPEEQPGVAEARSLLEEVSRRGVSVASFLDEEYPAQLREIREMPPVVFTLGRWQQPERRAIAVVGSRAASDRGLEMAYNIASSLAKEDVTVVSGLAAGIDTAAHTAALDADGRTVAVIGTGIFKSYPTANRQLQATIAERGMVLSQFMPDAPPSKSSFPMRNAVMSGFAAATIVVEAGERSGARIQARLALQHGRPLIFPAELLANSWARMFAGRPGVHVVDSISHMIDTAESLISDAETTVDDLVQAAVRD